MSHYRIQFQLGLGACAVALLLSFIAIPYWVSSPSNIANIVLSPKFWPYILSAFTGLTGLGLIFASRNSSRLIALENEVLSDNKAWYRLAVLAIIMIITMIALPRLGMVWTTMAVFAATAFLMRTRHPITALVCAVIIPLILYVFFAHVAGVAIPQGNFVRLP